MSHFSLKVVLTLGSTLSVMKVKPITPLAILMALGTIGNVLAGEGKNSLEFTLSAFISASAPPNNVNIKFYDHTGTVVESPLNLDPL